MIILIDIDDTISNFGEVLLKHLNEKYNTSYEINDITSWNWICEKFPNPWEVITKEFWEEVEVTPEAKNFIKKRLEKNDEIYLVTATFIDDNLSTKIENMLKKLDNLIDKKHIIITYNKTLLCGDVMIDDGFHNLKGNHCKLNICFSKPWNFKDWYDTCDDGGYVFYRNDNWNKIESYINFSIY